MAIIHRDLKPENIFITTQDGDGARSKILDFGIAQAKSARRAGRRPGDERRPAERVHARRTARRSSGRRSGSGRPGPWTDVWGLALTMVEALVGRQVIDGEAQAMMGTALDVKRRPTPRTEGASVPPEVDAVFERALAVSPRDRTRDIETFWTELEAAMGLAPTFGRAAALEDAYSTPPPPSSSMRAPQVKRAAHVWLDTPRDSGSLEIDLDVAPASMRSPRGGRRDGPASSVRPVPPPDSAGLEMDLPEATPSARGRGMGALVADSVPTSARGRAVRDERTGFAEATPVGGLPRAGGMESAPPSMHARGGGMMESTPPLEMALSVAPRATSVPPAAVRPLSDMPSARYRPTARPPADVRPRPPDPKPIAAGPTLLQQLGLPVACIVFACVVTVADLIMKQSGEALSFGPVRSFWVAGVLLLFGVGLFFWRMLGDPGDA